jgi:autotransporter-associated beta strand protein
MAITSTVQTNANVSWNTAAWDSGIPNGVDDVAQAAGDWTAARQMSIPAGLTYTVGKWLSTDNGGTYFDYNLVGANATTSKLNLAVSSGIPEIHVDDGGTISVFLTGNQGLRMQGGYAATDRITISNVNNDIYGPLEFNYSYLTTISGRLTAATRISSNNSFTGVTYNGTLGIRGIVDLLSSGLNIRTVNFLGEITGDAQITSSNGASFTDVPATHTTNLKISAPIVLAGTNAWQSQNTAGKTIEFSGVISGVSPAPNASTGLVLAVSNNAASGISIFRVTNPLNTYTGGSATVSVQSTSDTYGGMSILEYSTIANAGVPSSMGAGTGSIMHGWRHSTYRCIGAGGTSNRPLAPVGVTAGNYSLESSGTGPVIFNSTITSSFTTWPVLGGTNLNLNEISQPINFSKPLVKDNTGRWVLTGQKRYTAVTQYNAGARPWLTSLGKFFTDDGLYERYFIYVVGGYLRFKSGLDLRHNTTNDYGESRVRVYPVSSLELDNYSIPLVYQVGTSTTYYSTNFFLQGNGANNDGALRSVSGNNTFSPQYLTFWDHARINAEAGASLLLNVGNGSSINGAGYTLTFGGGGTITNQNPISAGSVIKDGAGSLIYNVVSPYSGGTTIHNGKIVTNVGGGNGAFRGPLTINSGSYLEVNADSPFGWTVGTNVTNVTINSGSYIQVNSKAIQNAGGSGSLHIYNNASARGSGDYYHENNSNIQASGQSYTETGLRFSMVNSNTNFNIIDGKFDVRGQIVPDIGGRTPLAGITKQGMGKLQLSNGGNTYAGPTIIQRGTVVVPAGTAIGSGSVQLTGSINSLLGVKINFKGGLSVASVNSSFVFGSEINETNLTYLANPSFPAVTNISVPNGVPGTSYALYEYATFNNTQLSNIKVNFGNIGLVSKMFTIGNRIVAKAYGAYVQVVTNLDLTTPNTITLGSNYKNPGTYGLISFTSFDNAQLSNLTVIPPAGYSTSAPFISGSAIYVTLS